MKKTSKKRNITSITNLVNKTNREIETMTDFFQIYMHVIRVANRFKFTQNQAREWEWKVLGGIRDKYRDNIYYDEFDIEVAEIGNYIYDIDGMDYAVEIPYKWHKNRSKKHAAKLGFRYY